MLFTRPEFFLLLAGVLAFLGLVQRREAQNLFLLCASYYFYACWDWRFLGLILLITSANYVAGMMISRSGDDPGRKVWLLFSLLISLGTLGVFKYFDFFVHSARGLLEPLGLHTGTLAIALPVGISFFTFQAMSYTIDVYRGTLPVCRSKVSFALFVAFFPQLVAGPIVRATELLPQIGSDRRMSWSRTASGFRQFTLGLFKKVFIADGVASFVDFQFQNSGAFDAATTWLAVSAYAVQLYCDFSGYSDMAIGMARVMGFDFSRNFDHPYLACTPTDFWRRWHISLSTWLRDYLFIPLGGSRKGVPRSYLNILVTMTLGGLWHGASWNFVGWGLIHGVALVVHKIFMRLRPAHSNTPAHPVATFGGWFITQAVVLVAWVFFRAGPVEQVGDPALGPPIMIGSFESAGLMLRQMFWPEGGATHLAWFPLAVVAGLGLHHLLLVSRLKRFVELPVGARWSPAALYLLLGVTLVFWPEGFEPFIYFQF